MAKFDRNIRRGLWAVLLVAPLGGCEGLQPYRISDPDVAPACNPDATYMIPEHCRTNVVEHSDQYDLFFTEFTDQGLQFPSEEYPGAAYQIDRTLKGLQQIAAKPDVKGISMVVFVHGWKHNASHDDGNVRSFRALLQSTARFEQARESGYRVVGVYVGWRGLSVRGEPLSNVSFWSRKAAALRVAQGSPRELFSRLRSFKCAQNHAPDREPGAANSGSCTDLAGNGLQRPKVRMLMIGHSFGAWILYNAVAGSLIESLTHAADTGDSNSANLRYADMVVLLNPAFEASRYTPLHRISTTNPHSRYQAPLLVSVTTSADWATGSAFPVGRFINTVLEHEVGDEERTATKYTMGHVPGYVTHELTATNAQPEECARWKPLRTITAPDEQERQALLKAQALDNIVAEKANTDKFPGLFPGRRQGLDEGWQRTFCGGARLTHKRGYDPNSAIWNVHTDDTIMTGHNDIDNPKLVEFVRQLYHDTLLYPRPANPAAASAAAR